MYTRAGDAHRCVGVVRANVLSRFRRRRRAYSLGNNDVAQILGERPIEHLNGGVGSSLCGVLCRALPAFLAPKGQEQGDVKRGRVPAAATALGYQSPSVRFSRSLNERPRQKPQRDRPGNGAYSPRSSRASHALASRQSRITVCGET